LFFGGSLLPAGNCRLQKLPFTRFYLIAEIVINNQNGKILAKFTANFLKNRKYDNYLTVSLEISTNYYRMLISAT